MVRRVSERGAKGRIPSPICPLFSTVAGIATIGTAYVATIGTAYVATVASAVISAGAFAILAIIPAPDSIEHANVRFQEVCVRRKLYGPAHRHVAPNPLWQVRYQPRCSSDGRLTYRFSRRID